MKKSSFVVIILSIGILFVFGVNLIGKSVHFYLQISDHDLICGASGGVCHLAWAEHFEISETNIPVLDHPETTFQSGPLSLHVSGSLIPLSPLRFGCTSEPTYHAIEFPWLLSLGIPAVLIAFRNSRSNRTPQPLGSL